MAHYVRCTWLKKRVIETIWRCNLHVWRQLTKCCNESGKLMIELSLFFSSPQVGLEVGARHFLLPIERYARGHRFHSMCSGSSSNASAKRFHERPEREKK